MEYQEKVLEAMHLWVSRPMPERAQVTGQWLPALGSPEEL